MISDNFHWDFEQNFCMDPEQTIRVAIYKTNNFGFKDPQCFFGFQNANFHQLHLIVQK